MTDDVKETPAAAYSSNQVKFPLRFKLGLGAAALAALPIAIVAALLLSQSWDVFLDAQKRIHLAVTTELKTSLENGLKHAQDDIDATGRVLTDAAVAADSRIALALSLVGGSEALDHVAIYDASGQIIDTVREQDAPLLEMPKTLPDSLINDARDEGAATGTTLSDGENIRVLIVLPFRKEEKVTGFGASYCSLGFLQNQMLELSERVFGDKNYDVFVLDKSLKTLVHTNPDRISKNAPLAGFFEDFDLKSVVHRHELMKRFTDDNQREQYGTLITHPSRQMLIGATVPADVIMAPIYKMSRWAMILLLIAIVVGVVLAIIMARRLTGPLMALTQFAERLANREFDGSIEVSTSDELNLVGAAMNQAAQDLQQSEARIKKETAIRTDLGRYLPEEIVDRVVRREQDMALGGERKEITVLFADVVSFTPMTENLDPQIVVSILNELFTILTEIVFKHEGMVDKFIGDSVMAIWGAPKSCEDHAARAIEASEDMLRWLELGNEKWKANHGVEIRLAIGINTGDAVVGNIGSTTRMEYTAIGEAVNMAARLEAVARPHQILVGERTKILAGDGFPFVEAGEHKLPGHRAPVTVFAIDGE